MQAQERPPDLYPRPKRATARVLADWAPSLADRVGAFACRARALRAGRGLSPVACGHAYAARRTALSSPAQALGDREHAWGGAWRTIAERAAASGVPMPYAAERDLHEAAAELAVPGPLWMAVSGPRQLIAHRTALARTVPEAQDDRRFGLGLASAAMSWVAVRAGELDKRDARPPGDASRAQLVLLLEAGASAADAHRVLPDLAGWCGSTAATLRRRWPDADLDPAGVPPYTWRARPWTGAESTWRPLSPRRHRTAKSTR
ncbi:hypothetical protein SSPIM334S_01751 [Streptomyces spiroverticillatus]